MKLVEEAVLERDERADRESVICRFVGSPYEDCWKWGGKARGGTRTWAVNPSWRHRIGHRWDLHQDFRRAKARKEPWL